MTNTDASGRRRVSDGTFFAVVALLMVLLVAGGMYVLAQHNDASTAAPVPTPTRASEAPTPADTSAPPATASPPESPSSPTAHTAPTPAGAVAVVEENFRLANAGDFQGSCALESPAYLKFDADHYPHGSCAGELQADAAALASQGLSMQLSSTKVASYGGDKATVLSTATIGTKVVTERVFLRYRDDTWWITGGDDSGDLGF